MRMAVPPGLRRVQLRTLCRLVMNQQPRPNNCPNMQVRSSGTESVSEQNRRRALEYQKQYSQGDTVSRPDGIELDEKPDNTAIRRTKPTAKEVAQARLRKHIPMVTGNVPTPGQLAKLLEAGHGALNVVVLDVRQKASFADWLLVCCGVTSNHVLAIADGIVQDMRALDVVVGGEHVSVSGRHSSDWNVVDVGTVVVHVMTDEARGHYRLEELWLPTRAPHNDTDDSFP